MSTLRSLATALLVFSVADGCASAGSSVKPSDKTVPPQMMIRGQLPQMRFMRRSGAGMQTYRIDIEVVIDSTGIPDMSTFKATGSEAHENRDVLYEWIRSSTYRPATRNGEPVSAIYHSRLEFRAGGP
jgi:hypothetical protein